jgi:hydroxyquinol 1,2-dioxygenase
MEHFQRVNRMKNLDEFTITQAVLDRQADCGNDRLNVIMASLVRHLHEFAREVSLTEEEWAAGIEFLTATGQKCSATRQEFILLSDTLGLSTLVCAQNNRKPPDCTEATVFGPFHLDGSPDKSLGADIGNDLPGKPCFISGSVRGLNGEPVADAVMEVWQADGEGFYDVQHEDFNAHLGRATFRAGDDGRYYFQSVVAASYPIPADGPVGTMLTALGRHPWRPAHVHFRITAPGYQTLITHVFRAGDCYLESDAVFGVRSSLIAEWVDHENGTAPNGEKLNAPFCTLNFDFVLNPVSF